MLRWVGGALVALLVIALFFLSHPQFKRYRIPSESMEPTIRHGEIINANGGEDLKVGDIVIFHPPSGAEAGGDAQCGSAPDEGQPCAEPAGGPAETLFIKRIVAGPGDSVAFERGGAIRNGKSQREPYITPCGDGEACDLPRAITVPAGAYYLVGDNRGASDDSRFWGPVREDWIVGRVERCNALYFFCSAA